MFAKAMIAICSSFSLALGALMAGTWFLPLIWTGPQEVGPEAYGLVMRGESFLAHY